MKIYKISLVIVILAISNSINAQFNKGLLFDGCSNYLEVESSSNILMGGNGITIEAWIMPNCDDGNRMIVSKQWCDNQYGYYLSVFDGKLFWSISPNGFCTSNSYFETSNVQIPSGVFSHIAIVHDATSIKLFVNGNLVPSQFSGGSFIPIYPSFENIRIGAYKNVGGSFGNFFSGVIDELRFYDAPLSAQQIKQNYNVSLAGNESNLVLYYDMEDNTGSGMNLKIENKCSPFSQHHAEAKGFMGNRPIIVLNDQYLNEELELVDEIEICGSNAFVDLDLDSYKEINWSTGETTESINVVNEGLYSVTVETELCRFLFDQVLVKNGTVEIFFTQNICSNDSIYFNNQWIYNSGLYQQVLTSQNGCDSTITLDVIFQDTVRSISQIELCQGDSLLINGQWIYEDGNFTMLSTTSNGCDSIASIIVDLIPQVGIFDTINLCQGDSVFINNNWYFGAQDVTYFDLNSFCPISVTSTIESLPSYSFIDNISICPNDSIFYEGSWISEEGSFLFNYKTNLGCDSVFILNTVQIPFPDEPISMVDCDSGIYELTVQTDINWSFAWSNGSLSNPIIFEDDTTASILYTHNDANCLVSYNIDLPSIPFDYEVPFFGDTIVYPGKPLKYMVDLDGNLWSLDWYRDGNLNCEGCFEHMIQTLSASEMDLIFTHISGCAYYRNFSVDIDASQDLYIPNIFAPESTSGNDKWKVYIPECFMIEIVRIYDRWGNLVYTIDNPSVIEWDGTYRGRYLEQGVFTYLITYRDPAFAQKIKSGDVTLIR